METVLSALTKFLAAKRDAGIAPDLLARWTPEMETQVLVGGGSAGRPVDGRSGCYTDGKNKWWNIRVPKNADSDPQWRDYQLDWPLDLYAEAIGSTGWDYASRASRWVGFDFDSLVGHAKGVGVDDDQLAQVRERACSIPYVEVRRSTGGAGLHLYVLLDAVPTENHTVHAALARSVLAMMSVEAGFDFASRIDCCGGNMWMWRNTLAADSIGLTLIKPAERSLGLEDLPPNWRDHIDVVRKGRGKTPSDPSVADVSSAIADVPLEDDHKRLIEALADSGFATLWVDDYHCLHTKTTALARIYDQQTVPVRGVFATLAEGKEPEKPNCYMFPMEGGGWRVYRFGAGTAEADTWTRDGAGRTTCFYNRTASFRTAAVFYGGVEDGETGEYVFYDAAAVEQVAVQLGETLSLPPDAEGREIRLGRAKNGKLAVKLTRRKGDEDRLVGWIAKKNWWYRVLAASLEESREESFGQYDDVFRKLTNVNGASAGWVVRNQDAWEECVKDDVKNRLESIGVAKGDLNSVLGDAIFKPWKLVNLPFQDEYPGGRKWNFGAAQLAYEPAALDDDEPPACPTWDLVMAHCGADLDDAVAELDWCREDRIFTGGDYLRAWLACLFRNPFEPLPYLFFFGDQNCGKSIFHEAASLLMTGGYVIADRALTNRNDFNGELANAILCVVEEKDLSKHASAYNKIKDWVTAPYLSIRRMRVDSYMQLNMTHWVQCANRRSNCPVIPGDTRIVVMHVRRPDRDIPKEELKTRLRDEAPHFLRKLYDLELPIRRGRLRLGVVETANKRRAEAANEDPLAKFLADAVVLDPDGKIAMAEFVERFDKQLPADERPNYTRRAIIDNLPHELEVRRSTGNREFIFNASWKTQ